MEIMEKPKVTKADFNSLDKDGMDIMKEVANERYKVLKGEELDGFIEKIFDIMTPETRNSMWESNHANIINEISRFIDNTGRMPTMFELSEKIGLSRQTLGKHLKEYRNHPQYFEHLEQFRFMSQKVLSKMFQLAMNGNVRAGRLYLEMVGGIGDEPGQAVNPKNFIQINNIILSQQDLSALRPDQIATIERVLIEAKVLEIAGVDGGMETGKEGSQTKRVPPRVPPKDKNNVNN